MKDYHAYYKTERGYHERSGNSTDGWNVTGCQSFLNQPLLAFAAGVYFAEGIRNRYHLMERFH